MIGPEHEAPRRFEGQPAGFSDAVTVAFGDPDAGVYGVARVGLSAGPGDARVASGLAVLFAGGRPVSVRAEGGAEPSGTGWGDARAAGVSTEVLEPLRRWRVTFESEDGEQGFELDLERRSEPAVLGEEHPAGQLGGMTGYEQLCRVTGTVRVDGTARRIAGRGQRGHSWGAPDWARLDMARTINAWLDEDRAVTITALRPAGAASHAEEVAGGFLLEPPAQDGDEARALPIADPRVSTTYDAEGRQRHAGLELYMGEDDERVHRAAGEVVCGTTLDLGRLRLDCAFFQWRMQGRSGIGRYDVLRRVGD